LGYQKGADEAAPIKMALKVIWFG